MKRQISFNSIQELLDYIENEAQRRALKIQVTND